MCTLPTPLRRRARSPATLAAFDPTHGRGYSRSFGGVGEEKQISSKLREENAALRKKIGELTRSSESEEEFITNALLKRMNRMREERGPKWLFKLKKKKNK